MLVVKVAEAAVAVLLAAPDVDGGVWGTVPKGSHGIREVPLRSADVGCDPPVAHGDAGTSGHLDGCRSSKLDQIRPRDVWVLLQGWGPADWGWHG